MPHWPSHFSLTTRNHTTKTIKVKMQPFFTKFFTALGVLLNITPSTAEFSRGCAETCLDKNDPNILVTRCSYAQNSFGEPSRWSEFDLNRLFAYRAPYIFYQEK